MKRLSLLFTLLFVGYINITCAATTEINQAPQPAALANQPQEIDWDFVVATLKKNNYTPVQIKFAIDLLKSDASRRGEGYAKVLEKEEAVVAQTNDQLFINHSFKWKIIALGSLLVASGTILMLPRRFQQIDKLTKNIKNMDQIQADSRDVLKASEETYAEVGVQLVSINNVLEQNQNQAAKNETGGKR